MKLDCSLVEDLYPLYEENELKENNRLAVEEHLKFCSKCSELYKKGNGFSELPFFVENKEEKLSKELDDRIRLRFRLRRMKVITAFLLVVLIVTSINRYAANREKVATLMDGMYLYSESLSILAKNPYEMDSNSQLLSYSVDDIIELDNELNWLERNPLKNTSYHFFVNTQELDEMVKGLSERKKQGLEDEVDLQTIELLQKQTNSLFMHVQKEYNNFHHGYSSYFEILNVEGISKPISKIEELAYFYNRYHKLPSEMKLMNENGLKEKIRSAFNVKDGKVSLDRSLNEDPGVYQFDTHGAKPEISGKINGYTGIIFWAVNNSQQLTDKKIKSKKEVMEKAKKILKKIYGNNAKFEIYYDTNSDIADKTNIYRLRYTPIAGEHKMLFQGSEPYFIEFDGETGEFNTLWAKIPTLSNEFFSKNYNDELSQEVMEAKAAKISGKKGKAVEKGIIYSTVSSDYVLVYIFEGKDNWIYINAETGVVEKPYIPAL
ncbi:zf-HC2 domain-containing protein [Bacillus sp. NEB1478]|uniref:zf-HC2 domain-containing protein n=1 Tax=Bacillus sp. NEB1478 TaxID=3073816 RepID=UPI002872DFE8|nr:zf-HC2 domain-containing protein [Bacillus sp. NEB1478]WNB92587.1 hypothetical protein RGB74_02665 [Bacillus sp. NEB1478]